MSSEPSVIPEQDPAKTAAPAWQPPRVTKVGGGSSPQVEKALADVRKKIYPRSVSGLFAHWRIAMVVLTQVIFYGLPWLQWNGRQAVLLDLAARKFYIFGMVLWPQDVIYLAVLLVLSAFALFLFTAMAGRLFCGYACPQTVYTEIFMWVERRIEGDRLARIRLDEQPWTWRKIRLKAAKHTVWILIAWWTGSTFIGYFAPIRELGMGLITLSLGPWQWFWMAFYAFATWGNAGFMREAVCKYMCPYARFQSVMVDDDTYVVTYDFERGEPRGGRSRRIDHKEAGMGDCVDCSLCVQVCPTGIDIRDGLQYMCIGCGACVDACDQVMEKMDYPKGLIRYTSGRAITEGLTQPQVRKRLFRPRVLAYMAILSVIGIAFVVSLATRTTLRVDVIRDRGVMGREVAGGMIENVYRLQIINTTESPLSVTLGASGVPGLSILTADSSSTSVDIDAASNKLVPVVLRAPTQEVKPGLYDINLTVTATSVDGNEKVVVERSSFFVPK
ncbi:cytochrome c oxidase accessory protein CcoG [Pollutimonas nitritireducens]|uniref:Cytochrome c oxidase accessory protein CcoG n=1 Tax=Pollutimonas nitritireducens TaxID=2045209 RepID=A0A2N4UIR2_9BURK|nr:cytochrome c oxidase accessory protein CcoG [Pollutimonas nitritireducens]PLC54914.1 cytochrome c oxidase accessory protein CcoG [Pollutimonas nitritireducens]